MIEIKCTAAEKKRLIDILDKNYNNICPFIGLCSELPFYKTGMSHRECIENNILWVITNEEAYKPAGLITPEEFLDAAARAATEYYYHHKNGDIGGFLDSIGFVTLLMKKLYKEEK